MARYIDADKFKSNLEKAMEKMHLIGGVKGVDVAAVITALDRQPTADVVPKSEVEKIFEKLKMRECSNAVCTWCVHANAYGKRNEECDKSYIGKNGKEQRACYGYAKFESLIDNELAELKKTYTEGEG